METLLLPEVVDGIVVVQMAVAAFSPADTAVTGAFGLKRVVLATRLWRSMAAGEVAEIEAVAFKSVPVVNYKHLSGEYPVASSFALWMAANIVKEGKVPPAVGEVSAEVKRILICNQYQNRYWSLMLVSQC